MFLLDKINLFPKYFSPAEFKIPFTDWVTILQKIEQRYIIKENSNYHFSNWALHIRQPNKLTSLSKSQLQVYLQQHLSETDNYWVVMDFSKHYVYDCKLTALRSLIGISKEDFFIVDKRYAWFTYFNREPDTVHVYSSGSSPTPFNPPGI